MAWYPQSLWAVVELDAENSYMPRVASATAQDQDSRNEHGQPSMATKYRSIGIQTESQEKPVRLLGGLVTYVDDLLLATPERHLRPVVNLLLKKYVMKQSGVLPCGPQKREVQIGFLGCRITRDVNAGKDTMTSDAPPPKAMPSASTKAETPTGKAASPGRPASGSAATDKGEKGPTPKASTTAPKAASDSGMGTTSSAPDKGQAMKVPSATSAVSTSQPKAASEAGSMPTPATPKAPSSKPKEGSEAGRAPRCNSAGTST